MAGKLSKLSLSEYAEMIADIEKIPKETVRLILRAEAEELENAMHQD